MFSHVNKKLSELDHQGNTYTISIGTITGRIYRNLDILEHSKDYLLVSERSKTSGPHRFLSTAHIIWIEINEI